MRAPIPTSAPSTEVELHAFTDQRSLRIGWEPPMAGTGHDTAPARSELTGCGSPHSTFISVFPFFRFIEFIFKNIKHFYIDFSVQSETWLLARRSSSYNAAGRMCPLLNHTPYAGWLSWSCTQDLGSSLWTPTTVILDIRRSGVPPHCAAKGWSSCPGYTAREEQSWTVKLLVGHQGTDLHRPRLDTGRCRQKSGAWNFLG